MEKSRITAPNDKRADYDFIAFSFNGKHSYEDFGIYRVIDGDRYNIELSPEINDKTAELTGSDGMILFGTNNKTRVFNVNFAFDNLTETKLKELRQWLNCKGVYDLWFAEYPYKVYSAKVTGQPNIKYIPFDGNDSNNNETIYKGEGTVQFTCYYPYAHTPDYVGATGTASGKAANSYNDFPNKANWIKASGIPTTELSNLVAGDLPTHFTASLKVYTPAELVYSDTTTKATCIGYVNAEGKQLIVQLGPETTTLLRNEGTEGYITWNQLGTYNGNSLYNLYAIDLSQSNITSIPNYCFTISSSYKGKLLEDIKLPPNLTDLGDMFVAQSLLNDRAESAAEDTYITSNGIELDRGKFIQGKSKTFYKMGSINKEKDNFVIQEGTKFLASYCCHQSKATSIVVPDGVVRIGAGAFAGCKNLIALTLPVSVKIISKWAFNDVNAGLKITYKGTTEQFTQITKEMDGQSSGIQGKNVSCFDEDYIWPKEE